MITCITFDDVCLEFLPLQRFKKFLSYLSDLSVPTTLFVVPCKNGNESDELDEFGECLKKVNTSGHELAQHGHLHSGNEYFGEFGWLLPIPYPNYQQQKKRIETGKKELIKLTGIIPKGFRAPFYLHNSNTLAALSTLGFEFDSSKTVFKPAHHSRIRFQMLSKIKPFKVHGILEIPVTGDYTYTLSSMNFSAAMERVLKDYTFIKSHGGTFVLNNHPNKVNLEILFAFLKEFVTKVSGESNFVRLKDVEHL